jgi:hypothetical protein
MGRACSGVHAQNRRPRVRQLVLEKQLGDIEDHPPTSRQPWMIRKRQLPKLSCYSISRSLPDCHAFLKDSSDVRHIMAFMAHRCWEPLTPVHGVI